MLRAQITVKGRIDPEWGDWFDGLEVTPHDEGITVLCGEVTDQSALYGILARIRDLGLELISVDSTAANEDAF